MEYIPGLDGKADANADADAELAAHVQRLIDRELDSIDTSVPHPGLLESQAATAAAAGGSSSLLPRSADGLTPFMPVSLAEKYTSQDGLDLQLLASHSQLRMARNSVLAELLLGDSTRPETQSFGNLLQLEAADARATQELLQQSLSKKRKLLQQVAEQRKRQILDFKPVDDFLNNRWNEKLNELTQLQIEKLSSEQSRQSE